ncbi:MAG: hypothetical protein JRJ60_23260, partial [Deltaproteobacteria bacterium]|nr:hypothetical protein [Deltaproteobacteria bacterium]
MTPDSANKQNPIGRRRTLFCLSVIAVVCIVVYSNSYEGPFVFDDLHNISENHFLRMTQLDWQSLYNAGFRSPLENRFVANISFALNYYLGGYHVGGYHLINVLIHMITGMLVFFLAGALLRTPGILPVPNTGGASRPFSPQSPERTILIPLFAALIFIAHPVQTQSVTYIVQRMNSMAVMFYLAALLLFILGRMRPGEWKRWALYLGALVSWAM